MTVSSPPDPGPSTKPGAVTVAHGQTTDLTALIDSLLIPGATGDTETIISASASPPGAAGIVGGRVLFTAPASGTDTVSYVVANQLFQVATGTIAVTVDPGPSTKPGAVTLGHNQTADLTALIDSLVTPGVPGDTETITLAHAVNGSVGVNGTGHVIYQTPATGSDTINYEVADQLGELAFGAINITVDPGPTTKSGTITIGHNQSADLTSLIGSLVIPGLLGDIETVTLVKVAAGTAVINGGHVIYTAPATGPVIGSDSIGYVVTDQFGDTATGNISVTVDRGPGIRPGAVTLGHVQGTDLTGLIESLVTPGMVGDTEIISAAAALAGQATIVGGHVLYTPPPVGPDTVSYTIIDQLGDSAAGTISVTVDPGASTKPGAITVGHNQNVDLTALINSLVTSGLRGDTETIAAVSAAHGQVSLSGGSVAYTPPSTGSDTVNYTVVDQFGDPAFGGVSVTVDPGPTAKTGAITVGHNQSGDLTTLIDSLVTPGLTGDTERFTAANAQTGQASIFGGDLLYTSPNGGSDTVSYTVTDQLGDAAAGAISVTVDPGPSIKPGMITLGHVQGSVDLTSLINGLVTPGLAGDTETITFATAGVGHANLVSGHVLYTPPAGGSDAIGYFVTDQLGDVNTGTIGITVDPGPIISAKPGAITVGHDQATDLTGVVASMVTPGLAGDTETVTSATAFVGGQASVTGGRLIYTAPPSGFVGVPAILYTVADQFGDQGPGLGLINVTVDSGPTTKPGAITIGHNQSTDLTSLINSVVTPGLAGDTETIAAASAQNGQAHIVGGAILYTSPNGGPDTVSYTVTDQLSDTATGTIGITVDSGPVAAAGATIIGHSQSVDLTALLNSLVTPGLAGDVETIVAAGAQSGQAAVSDGHLLYTTPASGSDSVGYTVADQFGDTAAGTISITVDPGPVAAAGATIIGHGQSIDLTALIGGLVTPGLPGDVETIIAAGAQSGQATVNGGHVLYTAPAGGSDALGYTVADQFGDMAAGTINVTVDPGPGTKPGAITLGHGQSIDLTALIGGLVTPGLAGDVDTIVAATAQSGQAAVNNGHVLYTAPASGLDAVGYTVVDQLGDRVTGAINVTTDPGPSAGAANIIVAAGQPVDLTVYLLGLDTPGLAGDTLSLSGAGTVGTRGHVTLSNGDLIYSGPTSPGSDSFLYSVADQYGDTASAKVGITVAQNLGNLGGGNVTVFAGNANGAIGFGNGNVTLFAGNGTDQILGGSGNDAVFVGNGNDTIRLNGTPKSTETIVAGSGNNNITTTNGNGSINAGNGKNAITVGNGNWTIVTTGAGATIRAGNGLDTITAGAGAAITVGDGTDTIITRAGSSASQNVIHLGDGADTVYASAWTTINAGEGTDVFWFGVGPGNTANPLGPVTINDFGRQDTINIAAGLGPVARSVSHGNTTLSFGGSPSDTITLTGYTGAVNVHLVS